MQIIILHKCLWLQSLCQISAWRQNMEELHFQSSEIQTEEQFGCVWIYHTISSSHMQTNTAAVPWASQQHGFVDGTQLIAMISSHSLPICLMAFLGRTVPGHKHAFQPGVQNSEVLQVDLSLSTDGKPVLSGLCCPAFGNQFFRKQKAFSFWKPANTEMSQIGQPREQLILWGLLVLWFFSVGRYWLRKGEL